MNKFLTSNKIGYRLARTVTQAVIGFIIANIDMLIGTLNFDGSTKAIIVALVMCLLSPAMKLLGTEDEQNRDETYNRPEAED